MLTEAVRLLRPSLEPVASAWIARGARSVSIRVGNQPSICWPPAAQEAGPEEGYPVLSSSIQVDGRVVGSISVSIPPRKDYEDFLHTDSALVAGMIPLSRDLIQVTRELIETRDQMLALYQITQSCRACISLEEAMRVLAQNLVSFGKARNAFVALAPSSGKILSAQYPTALYGEPSMAAFIGCLEREETRVVQQDGTSILLAGIRILTIQQEDLRGVIGLVNATSGDFGSPDIKLARAVAAHAGAQLENIYLAQSEVMLARMQTEMELAQRVQSSLLPKEPPLVPGLCVWGASRPAYQVGGDFYDFVTRPGLPATFVVGDISGKGFPAALLMSMTRTMIRTEINDHATPESVLEGANRALYDDLNRLSCFASVWVGAYFHQERRLLMANAGHSPIIYHPAGGKPRLLIADGPPLGIFPETESRNQSLQMAPGDLLLAGSDGLTDVSDPSGETFGLERLMELIESTAGSAPVEIARAIFDALEDFSLHASRFDDQTLVILQCE